MRGYSGGLVESKYGVTSESESVDRRQRLSSGAFELVFQSPPGEEFAMLTMGIPMEECVPSQLTGSASSTGSPSTTAIRSLWRGFSASFNLSKVRYSFDPKNCAPLVFWVSIHFLASCHILPFPGFVGGILQSWENTRKFGARNDLELQMVSPYWDFEDRSRPSQQSRSIDVQIAVCANQVPHAAHNSWAG